MSGRGTISVKGWDAIPRHCKQQRNVEERERMGWTRHEYWEVRPGPFSSIGFT